MYKIGSAFAMAFTLISASCSTMIVDIVDNIGGVRNNSLSFDRAGMTVSGLSDGDVVAFYGNGTDIVKSESNIANVNWYHMGSAGERDKTGSSANIKTFVTFAHRLEAKNVTPDIFQKNMNIADSPESGTLWFILCNFGKIPVKDIFLVIKPTDTMRFTELNESVGWRGEFAIHKKTTAKMEPYFICHYTRTLSPGSAVTLFAPTTFIYKGTPKK